MRSVMQRMQARDLYDLWYLMEIHGLDVYFLLPEFKNKCISKDVNPNDFLTKLEQRIPQYKSRWSKSISDQIKDLPEFETVKREIMRHFKSLDL